VRALHRTHGGTPRPHKGAQPYAIVRQPILVTVILPSSTFGGVRKGSGSGDVRVFPYVRCSLSARSLTSTPIVAGYEWVRDDVLNYRTYLILAVNVVALQCQVKLANPKGLWE